MSDVDRGLQIKPWDGVDAFRSTVAGIFVEKDIR